MEFVYVYVSVSPHAYSLLQHAHVYVCLSRGWYLPVSVAHTNRLPVRVWEYSMALGLGRELYSMCWGQGAAHQGKGLLSPCHRLVPSRFESTSVCMCVSDAVMRVGAQPNGHLTGAVALS